MVFVALLDPPPTKTHATACVSYIGRIRFYKAPNAPTITSTRSYSSQYSNNPKTLVMKTKKSIEKPITLSETKNAECL